MSAVTQLRGHSETLTEAARRLEQEARSMAATASGVLRTDLELMRGRLAELSTLGSIPAGERDVYRQLAGRIAVGLTTIKAISARA